MVHVECLAFCFQNPHRDRSVFKVFLIEVKHHIVTFFNLQHRWFPLLSEWWPRRESNPQPSGLEAPAPPIELRGQAGSHTLNRMTSRTE